MADKESGKTSMNKKNNGLYDVKEVKNKFICMLKDKGITVLSHEDQEHSETRRSYRKFLHQGRNAIEIEGTAFRKNGTKDAYFIAIKDVQECYKTYGRAERRIKILQEIVGIEHRLCLIKNAAKKDGDIPHCLLVLVNCMPSDTRVDLPEGIEYKLMIPKMSALPRPEKPKQKMFKPVGFRYYKNPENRIKTIIQFVKAMREMCLTPEEITQLDLEQHGLAGLINRYYQGRPRLALHEAGYAVDFERKGGDVSDKTKKEVVSAYSKYEGRARTTALKLHHSIHFVLKCWRDAGLEPKYSFPMKHTNRSKAE